MENTLLTDINKILKDLQVVLDKNRKVLDGPALLKSKKTELLSLSNEYERLVEEERKLGNEIKSWELLVDTGNNLNSVETKEYSFNHSVLYINKLIGSEV